MTIRYMAPTIVQVSKDLKVPACTFFAARTSSGETDNGQNGRILYGNDELVDDARDHGADCLGKNDLSHSFPIWKT